MSESFDNDDDDDDDDVTATCKTATTSRGPRRIKRLVKLFYARIERGFTEEDISGGC